MSATTARRPVCRVAYGYVAGYGFSGRGYVVSVAGAPVGYPVGTVGATPAAAWAAYRRNAA